MTPSSRLTEGQAAQQLQRILGDADNWRKRWDVGALTPTVEEGSSLAGGDRWSDPYQLSHGVTQMVTVAVDHLHALKVLIRDSRTLHDSAPYTLARNAIEAAATALWLTSCTPVWMATALRWLGAVFATISPRQEA